MAQRVAKFEKVSFDQFYRDVQNLYDKYLPNGNTLTLGNVKDIYNTIIMPSRATFGSAGHDFFAPFSFFLDYGDAITIPTGIKCSINNGWFLSVFPRSGMGFKSGVTVANTVGIIDSDYYKNTDNEGHIFIKLTNNNQTIRKDISVSIGEAFCQGIFLPYGVTHDEVVIEMRVGGLGSTTPKKAQSKIIDCAARFNKLPHLTS